MSSKPVLVVILLTVLAFGLRVGAMVALGGGLSSPYQGDEVDYGPLAARLAGGHGYTNEDGSSEVYLSPGVPVLLSLLFRVTGPSVVASRLFMCVVTSLIVPLCYWLGVVCYGRREGLLSATAATVFPHWLYYGGSVLTDVPAACLVTAMAALVVSGIQRNSWVRLGAAGVVWGMVTLTRSTCPVFLPAILGWVVLAAPDRRRRTLAVVVVFVPFLLFTGGWMIRNTVVCGEYVGLSYQDGPCLWISNNPRATGVCETDFRYWEKEGPKLFPAERYASRSERAAAFKVEAKRFIREHPGRFLTLCGVRFIQFWKIYSPRVPLVNNLVMVASTGLVLPFFLLRLVGFAWRRGPDLFLAMLIACQCLVHVVFLAIIRYRIPVEPLVLTMASAGAVWLFGRWYPADNHQGAPSNGSAADSVR